MEQGPIGGLGDFITDPKVDAPKPSQFQSLQFEDRVCFPLSLRIHSALSLLRDAALCAEQGGRNIWDFAVERRCLARLGLTASDCRSLLVKGLAEHAREILTPEAGKRTFQTLRNLALPSGTCFVITGAGIGKIGGLPSPGAWSKAIDDDGCRHHSAGRRNGRRRKVKPVWDPDRQQLRVDQTIVKQFRVPMPSQEIILAAFQETDWNSRIDDPLPTLRSENSKQRLCDTIHSLNRNQKRPLIHFASDSKGESVQWEFLNGHVGGNEAASRGKVVSSAGREDVNS